ncbi:DNA-binding HxlR family transcriptional regulator [Sphingomonas vulcanisoli]|uniref:DNA-binding HxlR family transcriptional regulator n=1 Tax=Sphingomonas vulcanisoli TaxID=1658060 RepID=A0ABX0TS10_9SPHN|nr:helix-turn-helix domain-containing protein [Sphingomonas vulcanisoli]NIJ07514.1 DNA-binding HxlR family transcriptional regulator [Sphingomonas vulcanisoli]
MKLERVTKPVEKRDRWYDDACGMALAMDLIGERWTLIILRELMYGPRRFGEIRREVPGISANVLTQRLERLEETGVVVREKLPPPASVQVYALTEWGRESEAMMATLGRWAVRSPLHDPTLPLSGAALMMSFRTMLDPGRAEGIDAVIGFRIGPDSFTAHLHDGGLDVARGEAEAPVLTFTADEAGAIAAAVYGGADFDSLIRAMMLKIDGDRALADRFVTLFPLPAKVA